MRPFVRSVPVKFKHGPRKTPEEVRTAVNAVDISSSELPASLDDVAFVDEEFVVEDVPCDLQDLISKNDRGPSTLQPA